MPSLRHQCGLSMIEVLVAIVILSVGLLGVAGLQAASLRASHSAFYRAQAAQFAADMAERMRANLGQAANYELHLGASGPAAGCTGVCAADVLDWLTRLRTLPAGAGSIAVDTVNQTVTIVVQWDDSRAGGASNAAYTVVTRLGNTN
ncbi:MAG: type IV pilus modification protein PilV [Sutterellaceae bacterium]|nr:type IV pilus modification protein PilV [Burkholderiaceae bacterium]MDW8429722.1 type IV pilus modification protein PilV [Sutterellaceae bacterium]